MATHEQLPSTSSHPPLDPTSTQEKSSKDATPSTAVKRKSDEAGMTTTTIHIGTRRSALAVIQAEMVMADLKKAHPEMQYEIHAMATMGDKNQVTALHEFGAKSLWTHELEAQLIEGKLDLIVHCLKVCLRNYRPNVSLGVSWSARIRGMWLS
jgi:hydroxymethylbilane synthase